MDNKKLSALLPSHTAHVSLFCRAEPSATCCVSSGAMSMSLPAECIGMSLRASNPPLPCPSIAEYTEKEKLDAASIQNVCSHASAYDSMNLGMEYHGMSTHTGKSCMTV